MILSKILLSLNSHHLLSAQAQLQKSSPFLLFVVLSLFGYTQPQEKSGLPGDFEKVTTLSVNPHVQRILC